MYRIARDDGIGPPERSPNMVIISNSSHYSGKAHHWGAGLTDLLAAVPLASHIVLIADTPYMPWDVPTCLKGHRADLGKCDAPRSAVITFRHNEKDEDRARPRRGVRLDERICLSVPSLSRGGERTTSYGATAITSRRHTPSNWHQPSVRSS